MWGSKTHKPTRAMNLHWIITFLLWITWLEYNICDGESAIKYNIQNKNQTSSHARARVSKHRMTHFQLTTAICCLPCTLVLSIPHLIQFAVVKLHFYDSSKLTQTRSFFFICKSLNFLHTKHSKRSQIRSNWNKYFLRNVTSCIEMKNLC